MQGVLYVGHGSRVPQAAANAASMMEQVKEHVDAGLQEICFLELAEPDIRAGFAALAERGATSIAVVPVLLLSAGHYYQDIPAELDKAKEDHPHIRVTYGRPLGVQDRIIDVMHDRASERGAVWNKETTILLVARGSRSPETKAAVRLIQKKIKRKFGVKRVEVGYMAVMKPSLSDTVEKLAEESNVLVLPYLWFTGILLEEVEEISAGRGWGQAACLGDHPLMTAALADRAEEAVHQQPDTLDIDESRAWWI
ncbi:sirohydrochlorin chelatase [Alkalicoccus chagannorensis]|uniref:sirohydrochlorin chelatase n=1 Tax=Alkalicoccus chagannorensis TaxID=427072 RepID=UPI0006863AA0|nr:sirohydrochlorin chelatase [Alkalicoccus chagannorensis]